GLTGAGYRFWTARYGRYAIRIDANQPDLYRWMITLDGRAVRKEPAPARDQAADAVPEALEDLSQQGLDLWVMSRAPALSRYAVWGGNDPDSLSRHGLPGSCGAHSPMPIGNWLWLGSDRGSPNHGSTVFSKRVMAQIRSPVTVRTYRPTPWRMPVGVRREAPNAG